MKTLQNLTAAWMKACFKKEISMSKNERGLRVLEEACELAQCLGVNALDARSVVRYVFSRPPGSVSQEIGGVAITLSCAAEVSGFYVAEEWERELCRIIGKIEEIREKQEVKPRHVVCENREK